MLRAATSADVAALRRMCERVQTDRETLQRVGVDFTGRYRGEAAAAVFPSTTGEVSQILAYCHRERLGVVPQGGHTGLVGGATPRGGRGEVVLGLGRMDKVHALDRAGGVLVAGAGCVLANAEAAAAAAGWTVPLDLGAKGSCQLGGNVATNAGGLRVVRYGPLAAAVLGLEVVLADGTVLDLKNTLRKDNTGLNLKQLFVGSEGALGVITEVALQLAPRPAALQVAIVSAPSFGAVAALLRRARESLGEVLSAFEFWDEPSMRVLSDAGFLDRAPVDPAPSGGGFYALVETSGSRADHDAEKLQAFLQAAMDAGEVVDGVVSDSGRQYENLWRLRENIPVAISRAGPVYKYDVSLPQHAFYAIVEDARGRVEPLGGRVVGYGHIGDGNLHLNVMAREYSDAMAAALDPWLYEYVERVGGSISAEHGVGQMKRSHLHHSKRPEAIALMRHIKQMLDPHGIMNPGKVIPDAPCI